ncbi:hypothetical protein [Actinomyces faecalis]|uniref:hypothetical protein n=1 Tax=Actinomyces faecalis TaxID=2722820 RepID=UPI001556D810|nr:hypothetical protein [Actinomyces faecalis]
MTSSPTGACWRAETQTAADLDFLDALAARGLLAASQVRAIHRQLAASLDETRVGFTRSRT